MSPAAPDERTELLAWGRAVRRDLPWRATRDPWAVLVSEVMLQQTQVSRVIPKWEQFLTRWPRPSALASASVAELLDVWSGLGYPRRAKALRDAAAAMVERHGGAVPLDLDALLALPGIGPYTARAVLTFAGEQHAGVVDTNIARVLARRAGHRLRAKEAQAIADEFCSPGRSWEHNQSLMDLGALVCRPAPQCDDCPIAPWCSWALDGWPDPDPAIGSAGVSGRQARFEGSDRQGRGRLLRAAALGPVGAAELAAAMGWPDEPDRAASVAATLVDDGLLVETDAGYVLPS